MFTRACQSKQRAKLGRAWRRAARFASEPARLQPFPCPRRHDDRRHHRRCAATVTDGPDANAKILHTPPQNSRAAKNPSVNERFPVRGTFVNDANLR
jgi:hypothetical protein